MRWPLLLGLAACSGSSGSGATLVVTAIGGDAPEAGATVLTSRDDGTTIDQQTTDGTGMASVGTESGALVSVVFPGVITATTTTISIVTTPVAASGSITIYGPPDPSVPSVAGAIEVTAPPLAVDFGYDIDLGCATIMETGFPATVNVISPCLGSDTNLDVLVRGYHFTGEDSPPEVIGYAAARLPFDTGTAELDITAWDTTGTDVPVTLTTVTPTVELDLWADGLMFPTPPIDDHALIWNNFMADASTVRATIGSPTFGQLTTIEATGVPASIALGPDDFLPQLASTVVLDDRAKLAIHWSSPGDAATTADALDLRVSWQADTKIVWDAVLPPAAVNVQFPTGLASIATLPASATIDVENTFRVIDSSEIADFDALQAAGLVVTDPANPSSIVPRPANGEVRTASSTGFH